jgi:hypothetical protein
MIKKFCWKPEGKRLLQRYRWRSSEHGNRHLNFIWDRKFSDSSYLKQMTLLPPISCPEKYKHILSLQPESINGVH